MLMGLRKLAAVAVEPAHRRFGLGRSLVQAATTAARRSNALLIFGQTEVKDGLESWYARQGFTVLAPDVSLDLEWLIDIRFTVSAIPGQRLFATTADGRPVPVSRKGRFGLTLPPP